MCAQEVMNIEEQCAEHFLLQNDRSAEQIQNIFGLRVKLLQNKFKISVMGPMFLLGAVIYYHCMSNMEPFR